MSFLWTKIYTQLHLALAEYANTQKSSDIGVSFPEYYYDEKSVIKSNLGRRIHIFADDTDSLGKLDLRTWLKRYEDYAPLSEITKSNETKEHTIFSRFQPKNAASLRRTYRRRIEKNGETEKEAQNYIEKLSTKTSKLPSIHLISLTTNQPYRIFIKKTEATKPSDNKQFTTYGLSKNGSTVPIF